MMNAQEVIDYLKKNRSFFKENPEIFDYLEVPEKKHGDGVVDFQNILLKRLRADQSKAQKMHYELIDTVRANLNNQSRVQTAILVLLEAVSFEEVVTVITQDFPVLLDVDTVNVVIEATSKEIPFVNQSGIRFARKGMVQKWLGTGDALLQDNIHGNEDIFGPGAGLVKSHALLRLEISQSTPAALLAFGSRNPDAFHASQGVEQVGFLAQVIERVFRIWLDIES